MDCIKNAKYIFIRDQVSWDYQEPNSAVLEIKVWDSANSDPDDQDLISLMVKLTRLTTISQNTYIGEAVAKTLDYDILNIRSCK